MSASRADAAAKRRRLVLPEDEKRQIVAETYERWASVSAVARHHDLNANLPGGWGDGVVRSTRRPFFCAPGQRDDARLRLTEDTAHRGSGMKAGKRVSVPKPPLSFR